MFSSDNGELSGFDSFLDKITNARKEYEVVERSHSPFFEGCHEVSCNSGFAETYREASARAGYLNTIGGRTPTAFGRSEYKPRKIEDWSCFEVGDDD